MVAIMTDEKLLTVPEVADRLRLSVFTVRELLKEGRLRGFRLGGTKSGWRVSADDLERFIRESRERGTSRADYRRDEAEHTEALEAGRRRIRGEPEPEAPE